MAARTLACLLALACWGASPARAQEAAPCPAAPLAGDTAGRAPDLVIRASARADAVRFGSEPEVRVRLTGCSVLDTVRVLERRNLPEPVEPGVTYRDVFVAVEILGHLDVRCLLPALAGDPAGAAPDSAAADVRALLARLCPTAGADSIPRPPPRR